MTRCFSIGSVALPFVFLFLFAMSGLAMPGAGSATEMTEEAKNPLEFFGPVPYNAREVFKDDELFFGWINPSGANLTIDNWWPTINSLSQWDKISGAYDTGNNAITQNSNTLRRMASASGHILNGDSDDVALAYIEPVKTISQVNVMVFSGKALQYENNFWGPGMDYASLDISVGDLDMKVDEDGYFRDEIVLVNTFANSDGQIYIRLNILDYNLSIIKYSLIGSLNNPNLVAVAIGDYNGDGYNEIAVSASNADHYTGTKIETTIWSFRTDPETGEVLLGYNMRREASIVGPLLCQADLDMASGDFDGDGIDELFLVLAGTSNSSKIGMPGQWIYYDIPYDEDNPGVFNKINTIHGTFGNLKQDKNYTFHQLRVVPGLFYENEYYPLQKQVAVCGLVTQPNEERNRLLCDLWEMKPDSSLNHIAVSYTKELFYRDPWSGKKSRPASLDIASGNFRGHGVQGQTSPDSLTDREEQLAVAFSLYSPGHWDSIQRLYILDVDNSNSLSVFGTLNEKDPIRNLYPFMNTVASFDRKEPSQKGQDGGGIPGPWEIP